MRRARRRKAPSKGGTVGALWLWLGGIAVAVVLGVGVLLAWAGRSQEEPAVPGVTGGPSLYLDHLAYDFGRVPFDVEQKHTFEIQNVGDAPLVLGPRPEVRLLEGC